MKGILVPGTENELRFAAKTGTGSEEIQVKCQHAVCRLLDFCQAGSLKERYAGSAETAEKMGVQILPPACGVSEKKRHARQKRRACH